MDKLALFDAHCHIIDPRFPLIANQGFLPDTYTVTDYRRELQDYGVIGGVVVSGSFQGFDQRYLIQALSDLGSRFVGVTQVPSTVSDDEILALHEAGVRGIRFNLRRGGSESAAHLKALAMHVYRLVGWHTELYIDARGLPDLVPLLKCLPAVSVDHLGLSKDGLPHLLALVEKGIRVKASGFSRCNFDVGKVLRTIDGINPRALMFGSDLPCTRAPSCFSSKDVGLIAENLGWDRLPHILFKNALQFYRLENFLV